MTRKSRSTDTEREVAELLGLAEQLSTVELPQLDPATKRDIAKTIGLSRPSLAWGSRKVSIGVVVFAVVAGLALLVQSATPGTPLYKVKSSGEDIRGLVQPGFKDELQKRRDQQSQPLPASSGSSVDDKAPEASEHSDVRRSGHNDESDDSRDDADTRSNNSGSSNKDDQDERDEDKSGSDRSGSSRDRDESRDKPDDD